ncbi:Gfo/Idh/MocA family oxidoreductase [Caulobacter sp.]|uniref:Gfo/Idh/MocA family protein n=1 Tax=Caulobacter sp. TaxID=78 RepID=UPI001B002199|nr:Gfo/Idh/MocA family oxidoreductase [Caulobacter sp.]MBO9546437.1 Gfo/Idh/MocA family oxidoreductase [Caulobacter sp.]
MNDLASRRAVLMAAGLGGAALASGAAIAQEVAAPGPALTAKHKIKFAVIGLDHYHIMSMTAAVKRGGGECVWVYAYNNDAKQLADFKKQHGDVPVAASIDQILNDKSVQLVAAAPIPDQRTPLGLKVMAAGKDYLADKPGIITLEQLAQVRAAVKKTGRKYAIMYSERLEVPSAIKAGELVMAGAIGKVVQTVNLAPHRIGQGRPDWFWDKARYGGILTDIGSHQADQFLFYTGSKTAKVVASQVGNIANTDHPKFEDFGDLTAVGDGGTGYVRVDWYTPDGLGVWGDGRLFILGTEGYIELRKYIDPTGRPGANHLLIVDKKQARYIDCSQVQLPFGPQFVTDIVERTSIAQDQEQALLAAELVLTAQKNATKPVLA